MLVVKTRAGAGFPEQGNVILRKEENIHTRGGDGDGERIVGGKNLVKIQLSHHLTGNFMSPSSFTTLKVLGCATSVSLDPSHLINALAIDRTELIQV